MEKILYNISTKYKVTYKTVKGVLNVCLELTIVFYQLKGTVFDKIESLYEYKY